MIGASGIRISCRIRWRAGSSAGEELEAARQAGFDAVEVEAARDANCEELCGALAGRGLAPTGLMVDLWDLRRWAPVAQRSGLPSLGIWAGNRQEQSAEALADEVRLCLGESGGIGLELRNRCGSRLEQLEDFRELLVRVPDERLHVVIDALEFHRASVDPRGAVTELADRATGLVLADAVGNRQVPLGEGELNVAALLGYLKRASGIRRLILAPTAGELAAERQRLEAIARAVPASH